ncbi:MAG: tyrosine--tRNA ligase [SAR202 cluster bacterium]|nr:MAG: tyrosine--tRNA ligase [SAR202 cluster bacterium]
MPLHETQDILKRGVEEIIIEDEFLKSFNKKSPLRLKMGFDPSAPDIHLGHAVGLRKLRQLQELGHKVVLIVGDWTAQIGDPSGRSQTRKMLTPQEVNSNAQTYLEQFFKIVDKDRTEIRWQSEWFGDFNLTNVIELTSNFTVAQILARDDFSKRFKGNHPISITELLYPLLQAYDSLAIDSQVEFGGTDQKFNLLLARELQQIHKKNPQHCFIMPLLPGTDGIQKMSKSLGNYVGINESPNDIFGKIMSIPDSLISSYYYWLTDIPTQQIEEIEKDLSNQSTNPINFKKNVALEIVSNFYSSEESESAQLFFERTVQEGEIPNDIPEYTLKPNSQNNLSNILVETGICQSSGEAKRLISQGAIKLENSAISSNIKEESLKTGILKAGRRKYLRFV